MIWREKEAVTILHRPNMQEITACVGCLCCPSVRKKHRTSWSSMGRDRKQNVAMCPTFCAHVHCWLMMTVPHIRTSFTLLDVCNLMRQYCTLPLMNWFRQCRGFDGQGYSTEGGTGWGLVSDAQDWIVFFLRFRDVMSPFGILPLSFFLSISSIDTMHPSCISLSVYGK